MQKAVYNFAYRLDLRRMQSRINVHLHNGICPGHAFVVKARIRRYVEQDIWESIRRAAVRRLWCDLVKYRS